MGLFPRLWRREEVRLGMILTKDDIEQPDPLLYKVVGICDNPTVIIAPVYERDGDENEHYVIGSRNFAEFRAVKVADHAGDPWIHWPEEP